MTASTFTIAALWSYGLATAGFAVFAIRLAVGRNTGVRARLLLAATIVSALWAASGAVVVKWPSSDLWLASVACDALRYAVWYAFLLVVLQGAPNERTAAAPRLPMPTWVVALVAVGLVASILLAVGQPFEPMRDSELRRYEFDVRVGLAVFGLILVEQLFRRAHPQARWTLRPLCVALAGVFAFDLAFYANAMLFGHLDVDIWVARGIANALVIPFIAVATARNPVWTVDVHLSRDMVFHSTAILVSGVFLLGVAGAGFLVRYLGTEWGRAVQIVLLFAAVLIVAYVASSGSFRAKLKVFVSKHFFSYRYDYREEWLRFTRMLSTADSAQGMLERCIMALANLVESRGGTLWLNHEHGFRPAARCNMPAIEGMLAADASLPRFLARTGWVINIGEYVANPGRYPELALPEWLVATPGAWLIVPLVSGTELVGFVVLASPRTAIEVNWEVLDLLKTASRQAASYLGQLRASEALLEARKFAAFNRMSAFVVHDLKNLVAQLSLMLRNAERHRANAEFQKDMLMTVEHAVGRMNHLMLQLRTEATPVDKPRPIDLESVVRRVCAAKTAQGAVIELELAPGIFTLGHEERLDHVIGHLIQNALDATADAGSVKVRLAHDDGSVILEVADTGRGMSPEFIRDRLFKPFETTKSGGMGIGVYESAQYVATLGGQIAIDSSPDAGTRGRVVLPPADRAPAPDAAAKVTA